MSKKTNFKRVTINVPIPINDKVMQYAEGLGLNMTSAYLVLINQAIEYQEVIKQLPLFSELHQEYKINKNRNELNNSN